MNDEIRYTMKLRVSVALLQGKTDDAERIANGDPACLAIIAEWKIKWVGFPHGQWDGGENE